MQNPTICEKPGSFERMAIILLLALFLTLFFPLGTIPSMAQSQSSNSSTSSEIEDAGQPEQRKVKPSGPADEFNRGVPRSSLKGYLKAARDGDFQQAAKYLDLRYLPDRIDVSQGPKLARPT